MPPIVAALVCLVGIAGLFLLDRDARARSSPALAIPYVWLCIGTSRTVSQWFGNLTFETADKLQEGSRVDAIVFGTLIVLALLILRRRTTGVKTLLSNNFALLLFFSYCAVSVCWSDYPLIAAKRWIKALGDLAMVLIVVTDPAPDAVKRVFGRLGFLLVPLSILTIRYYPAFGRSYSGWTGEAFNIGVANGKNSLGCLCMICGVTSFWCLVDLFHNNRRLGYTNNVLAHCIALLLTLYLFRITHSATSFACFVVGCGLIMAAKWRGSLRNLALVHAFVGLVILAIVYTLVLDPSLGLLQAVGRDATLTGRTRLWEQVLRTPVNPLLGTGYESFWLGERLTRIWAENWEQPTQAHNGYLELYLDLGWIGIFAAAAFMIAGYRTIVGALRRNDPTARLLLAYFVIAIIYNFTEHAFRELHPVWLMLLLSVTATHRNLLWNASPKPLATAIIPKSRIRTRRALGNYPDTEIEVAQPPSSELAAGYREARLHW